MRIKQSVAVLQNIDGVKGSRHIAGDEDNIYNNKGFVSIDAILSFGCSTFKSNCASVWCLFQTLKLDEWCRVRALCAVPF